jgi:hypothetical protein
MEKGKPGKGEMKNKKERWKMENGKKPEKEGWKLGKEKWKTENLKRYIEDGKREI